MKIVFALLAALLFAGCLSAPVATPTPSPTPTLTPEESLEKLDSLSRKVFSLNDSEKGFAYGTVASAFYSGNVLPHSNLTVYWQGGNYSFTTYTYAGNSTAQVVLLGNQAHVCTVEDNFRSCSVSSDRKRAETLFFKALLGRLSAVAAGKPADAVTVAYLGASVIANRSCEAFGITIDGSKVEETVIDSNAYVEIFSTVCLDSQYGVALYSSSDTHVKVLDTTKLKDAQAIAYAKSSTSMKEELAWFNASYNSIIKAP